MTKRDEVISLFSEYKGSLECEYETTSNEPLLSQEYNGEFKYCNYSPIKLKEMEAPKDEKEFEAYELAKRFWELKSPRSRSISGERCETGEPYRGEAREAKHINNMRELIEKKEI